MPLVVGFQSLVHLIVSFLDCHRCSVSYFLFTQTKTFKTVVLKKVMINNNIRVSMTCTIKSYYCSTVICRKCVPSLTRWILVRIVESLSY